MEQNIEMYVILSTDDSVMVGNIVYDNELIQSELQSLKLFRLLAFSRLLASLVVEKKSLCCTYGCPVGPSGIRLLTGIISRD
jgi:hypothetical protein